MKNGRRSEPHQCIYVGPEQEPARKTIDQTPPAPSVEFARTLAIQILDGNRGRYRLSDHFRQMREERGFDVFDILYAIRNGACLCAGDYCDEFKDFKYVFRCNIDGVEFEAVFGLSAEHDLIASPLLILITGYWKTKTGLRSRRL